MKFILLVCVVALWATTQVLCASKDIYDLEKEPTDNDFKENGILPGYEGESPDMDYDQYQYQRRADDEVEGDSVRDEAFDCELTDESGRPSQPEDSEIQKVCEEGKQGIESDAKNASIDLYSSAASCTRVPKPFAYFTNREKWVPFYRCCPRTWNYGCRHINARLPCFVNYNKYFREWCCPLFPYQTIARCLCDKCAIQTRSCIHLGRCQKRYTRRSFVAVCYRYGWRYLRLITKWVPSSCYCRA